MLKLIFLLGLFGNAAVAVAETGQSSFHWISSKCESEAHDTVETTPQSPPLDVDDPGTPGCNQWEVNVLASGNVSQSEKKYELPLLDINYGIGDNLQLKYEVPNLSSQGQGETVTLVGSSKLGLKYGFFESEENHLEMAIYPQFEFITPGSKAAQRGLESPGNVYSLPLLLAKKIGQVSAGDVVLTTNFAYNYSTKPDTANSISILAGVGMPLSAKVSVMGEISSEQALALNDENIREHLLKVNVGMIYKAFKQVSIFGSLGESLVSSDQINHTYFVSGIRL